MYFCLFQTDDKRQRQDKFLSRVRDRDRDPRLKTNQHRCSELSKLELSTVELSTIEFSTVEFSTELWNIRQQLTNLRKTEKNLQIKKYCGTFDSEDCFLKTEKMDE